MPARPFAPGTCTTKPASVEAATYPPVAVKTIPTIAVDTVIEVKRQSDLRDNFWLFQSLA
jgi:hypothetical protein